MYGYTYDSAGAKDQAAVAPDTSSKTLVAGVRILGGLVPIPALAELLQPSHITMLLLTLIIMLTKTRTHL